MIYVVFKREAAGSKPVFDVMSLTPETRNDRIGEILSMTFNRRVDFYGSRTAMTPEKAIEEARQAEAGGHAKFRRLAPAAGIV